MDFDLTEAICSMVSKLNVQIKFKLHHLILRTRSSKQNHTWIYLDNILCVTFFLNTEQFTTKLEQLFLVH